MKTITLKVVVRPYKYMHTIDGMPAHYYSGEQICFALRTRPIPLCDTIAQIKREQAATIKWRAAQGYISNSARFGWVKVSTTPPKDWRKTLKRIGGKS